MTLHASVQDLFHLAGARWTAPTLISLCAGRVRFSHLRRTLPGVSQKQLAATLRLLERDGYVSRTAFASIPPRVEYELTPLGASLADQLRQLEDFAVSNATQVAAARTDFEDRMTAP